ncbi:UNVERIFIED_CONTAM: hypothetical protein FKN15_024620 [Acipenser sinensis]
MLAAHSREWPGGGTGRRARSLSLPCKTSPMTRVLVGTQFSPQNLMTRATFLLKARKALDTSVVGGLIVGVKRCPSPIRSGMLSRANRVRFHDQSHVCLEGAEGFGHLRGGGLNSRAFSRGQDALPWPQIEPPGRPR